MLQVHATADSPRYECSAPSPAIVFRPTMMFQTRSFTFSVTNSALTALKYRWMVLDKQGSIDESGACRCGRVISSQVPLVEPDGVKNTNHQGAWNK
jgi:hypothetical protein